MIELLMRKKYAEHSRLSKKMTAMSFPDKNLLYIIETMKRKFLPLYSNKYLGSLVELKSAFKFRDYLEAKFHHKRKRFRCLADVEEWMVLESFNFLKKGDKSENNNYDVSN